MVFPIEEFDSDYACGSAADCHSTCRCPNRNGPYSFCAQSGCTDGFHPQSGLVRDQSGNLYGTTPDGGANAKGTVFEVRSTGTETVLYSFCSLVDCDDGYRPLAGMILDTNGNLYGTAFDGGAHDGGVVFEVSP